MCACGFVRCGRVCRRYDPAPGAGCSAPHSHTQTGHRPTHVDVRPVSIFRVGSQQPPCPGMRQTETPSEESKHKPKRYISDLKRDGGTGSAQLGTQVMTPRHARAHNDTRSPLRTATRKRITSLWSVRNPVERAPARLAREHSNIRAPEHPRRLERASHLVNL